jgi:hypothetical protein
MYEGTVTGLPHHSYRSYKGRNAYTRTVGLPMSTLLNPPLQSSANRSDHYESLKEGFVAPNSVDLISLEVISGILPTASSQ